MLRHPNLHRRPGASLVETAIVLPLAFFFIFGLIFGALGVFRYQQVASLAREGARFASVHGGEYAQETGNSAATEEDIRNYMKAKAFFLEPVDITITLKTAQGDIPWDSSNKWPFSLNTDNGNKQTNIVSITVTYQWIPEMYLTGPITLTSTSDMPMSF